MRHVREFCTLFDSNYLVKAVAMHRSLLRHCPAFHLTAFCFDDEAKALLGRLRLPHLTTVGLAELEAFDPALLSTKPDRTPVEYCWTATPALPRFMLGTRADLDEITYLDADLLFFSDPEPLFAEMGSASVLITPHRFPPRYAHEVKNGVYNVQFLTFRRDGRGEHVLGWWHDRCIEWCYYRLEDGKLGDQKYLDDWPKRFEGVHVLRHRGGGLAPWNITGHRVAEREGGLWVDDDPLVFFHFYRVKLLPRGYDWQPPGYWISRANRRLVYDPYLAALDEARQAVRSVAPGFARGVVPAPTAGERLRRLRDGTATAVVRRVPAVSAVRRRIVGQRG